MLFTTFVVFIVAATKEGITLTGVAVYIVLVDVIVVLAYFNYEPVCALRQGKF